GGQGTAYNSSNPKDKTYARIDGGTSNPGYFTEKGPEAYACYTPSNTTLTFYYDNQRSSRTGTTYDLNTGDNITGWESDGTNASVTKVVFDSSFAGARPTTTSGWFYDMWKLESMTGMSYLNTSEVTNMSLMFYNCTKLTSLDVSHFNTSKVIYMTQMFAGCSNLQTITVGSDWSTAAVTSSTNMFNNCTSLVGGQGTTYDANHVDKTYAHIDGGPSNPGYFTEWKEAYACYTPSNTTLTFYYDSQRSSRTGTTYVLNTGDNKPGWRNDGTYTNVTKVVFDPSFANARPTTTYGWFYSMNRLQSIVGMHNYLNTSEVTNMDYMFYYCDNDNLTSLDLSHFNTSKVTKMGWMFYFSSNLRTIYVGSGWSTAAVTNSNSMFYGCTHLVGGQGTIYSSSNPWDKTYAHIDGGPSNPGYFTDKNAPVAYACYTPSNTTLTFYYDNQRSSRTGTTYDLNEGYAHPGWESDGTNASVTKAVFDPSFANARPTTTYDWFFGMENLQSITGMSYLNTSEVTNMAWMFGSCKNLTSLDLSHFNTSKVTDMGAMFPSCKSLTSLDLSSFNTSKVTTISWMLSNCTNLRTIYVGSGWSTAAVTNSESMFGNCSSLVGGQGTTWDASNPTDKTYAHIDGGTSNPGYFTDKNASQRGDVNGDGSVNISDVTTLIDYLLSGNASGINLSGADCNQDSSVNISDVTSLIDYLLSNHW
ncbi:MAG: BspA family leucine-rich repeat surface protein, partial [Muribaculaceae bacterium]|nr:BspA family leucine-rich repeat surface protein [Muribaculaceae bacterium]